MKMWWLTINILLALYFTSAYALDWTLHSLQCLSANYNANPSQKHLLVAKHVLCYLLGTQNYALEYNFSHTTFNPSAHFVFFTDFRAVDMDWASNSTMQCSISGYAFFIYSNLVLWSSVCQCTVTLSSTEAEYMSLSHAMHKALSICYFITSLGLSILQPFPIYCDNKSALNIANSDSTNFRSKHINIHYHFVCEFLQAGSFQTSWVSTTDMVANILTQRITQ